MTARQHLDRCLERFVTHAIAGEDDKARTAFADAQAVMADVRAARDDAQSWLAREQAAATHLGADVEDLEERKQIATWAKAPR